MKIGIELNGVIRDINQQIVDYYRKDFDKSFDVESVDLDRVDFLPQIPFKSKEEEDKFMYIDYPYEVFGCAGTMHMHLPNTLNTWHRHLPKTDDILLFSLMESGLSIQSSYFFLSKIGCKIREVFFPKKAKEIWDKCDVVITTNKQVVRSKPQGKKVILIKKSDNMKLRKKCDLVYSNLTEICQDANFLKMVKLKPKKENVWNQIKKFFKRDGKTEK